VAERLDAFTNQVVRNAIADDYRKGRREQPLAPEAFEDHALAEDGEDTDSVRAERSSRAACAR
jgi:DNA-directed RNA polymerase specialized sigma24 family protein